jgi:hypothetical protein
MILTEPKYSPTGIENTVTTRFITTGATTAVITIAVTPFLLCYFEYRLFHESKNKQIV